MNDAIHHGIIGLRCRFGWTCSPRTCGRRRRGRGSRQVSLHAALENECGPHAHTPQHHDHAGIHFRLNLRICIVNQRRDENFEDRPILDCRFIHWQRRNDLSRSNWLRTCILTICCRRNDFQSRRRRVFCELRIAGAPVTAPAKAVQLPIEEQHVARLRYDDVLSGKLLFQPHRATVCADAHRSRSVKTNQGILRTVANRDGLYLKKWRVNRYGRRAFDGKVNCAGIQSHGEQIADLENREMRWPADADGAALGKIQSRSPGFDAYVAAAPQDCSSKSAYGFDAHGAGDSDGRAVDDSNRIGGSLIGASRQSGQKGCSQHSEACQQPNSASRQARSDEGKRHSLVLPAQRRRLSPILYVGADCRRTLHMMAGPPGKRTCHSPTQSWRP